MTLRRKLDNAKDYSSSLQPVHELQAASILSGDDITSVLDVSEPFSASQAKKATLSQIVEAGGAVVSDPAEVSGAGYILNIISLTQAQYDAIVSPSATTLYVVTG